ncbi:MAG: S-adenosylmethionine:tRNA ribosyltransferase-isomerase, partial [Ghiorsea sp.]|nr:S-adenosylmethionine:tRNA ribosyltransferase-isomerase [Ghiorsea sp.]
MNVSDFDFELPEHLIAKAPLEQRDGAKLLYLNHTIEDKTILDLPSLVQAGDVWVINDTKVIPARLIGKKSSGGKVEVLLLEPLGQDNVWSAWGKANKPLSVGTVVHFSEDFSGEVLNRDGKNIEIQLIADDVGHAIESHGHMPLPPYIN